LSEISNSNGANGAQDQATTADPTPRRRKPSLQTAADVHKEMARVYRAAKRAVNLKDLKTQDASRLIYVLQAIQKVIEGSELANRIEQLEKALQAQRH
jgi:hypothetical protein